ncbi:MAG TPA: Gfo/Idh/MocA family oxidoreductase [Gemmataceae bacterium]|nr:Gfo/Idh/MocA family oxidoreductase [Gemmataceae bacterium]
MATQSRITRRTALKSAVAAVGAIGLPAVYRAHAHAAPVDTVLHASFGASGMAGSDIGSLTASKHLRLVAVADVDLNRTADVRKRFPNVRVYQDWRELLDKEKDLTSANISTPDHMHAPITMRCMQRGLHVYTQKPLTQTIYESRRLKRVAADRKLITQMGIQIHSHQVHRQVVAMIQGGAIGKVREVHSWSNKTWGDRAARPDRTDPVPANFSWDQWLGVAADRPFIGNGYYHPGNWRKRLDFGTGTFGDMGCHILDPVFASLSLTAPTTVRAEAGAVTAHNWGLDCQVRYTFPGTKVTADNLTLFWYDGAARPPRDVQNRIGNRKLSDQGSIYIGSDGVLYSPYIAAPILLPEEKFRDYQRPNPGAENHYLQFVEAIRGNGRTSAPFDFSANLTESVLLGCLSTRFQKSTLNWDTAKLQITNNKDANEHVRRRYRKRWEVEGL